MYIGEAENLRGQVNEAYEYVCTCMTDANGIKSMLGSSDESNAVFSSCSEAGSNEIYKQGEKDKEKDANLAEANKAAVK